MLHNCLFNAITRHLKIVLVPSAQTGRKLAALKLKTASETIMYQCEQDKICEYWN